MPQVGYGDPNISNWAAELKSQLIGGGMGFGIDYRILASESGEFARFQFRSGLEQLILDLVPGPISEFGRTFEMVYAGGGRPGAFSGATFGAELIAMPGTEEVSPRAKPVPLLEFRDPLQAMSSYIEQVFTNKALRRRYPHDPARRLGQLLYKGIQAGPVAGGLQQSTMFHTGLARELMARSVAVAIHPDLRDQKAVHEAIYGFATQAAISDPTSPVSALQYYAPHKQPGDIVRLHPFGLGFAGWGEKGQYDPTYWGLSTEQINALSSSAKAAQNLYKRQTVTYGMMGIRQRAELFGVGPSGQMVEMEPEYLTGAKSSAGWKWLNALAPGQTERMAAYVRPGVVFTPSSPVSGAGFLYGPEGWPEGAAMAGIRKRHRVALPPVGIQNIPGMSLEFGIYKRERVEGKGLEYIRQANLPGYALGAGESAIIGLMRYRAETGEQVVQEITYGAGTSPVVFRDQPRMYLPPQYNIATGEGMAGFAKNIGIPTLAISAAAKEKFGIPVYEATQGTAFLEFPLAGGVAPSGKAFGVKAAWQQLETPMHTQGWDMPTVDVYGRKMLVRGMTGEIKERISHFAGVFYGMTPEQQLMAVGEFATGGAMPEARAMAEAMQRHIKTVNLKYFLGQGDPGAVSMDVLGQIYSAYTGTPFTRASPYAMLNAMRGIIESPGYEATALERYGHAKVGPAWYPVGLGGRDQWRLFRQSALEGVELLLHEEGLTLSSAAGRKRFRQMIPGGIGDIVRWNRERAGEMTDPFGKGELGYLEFKSRGLFSTMTSILVPEFMSKLPLMGTEEKMSLMIANPELAKELGVDAMMGPEGVVGTGYGFTPPHLSGWRQIGEVARNEMQRLSRSGPMRPANAIDVTPELERELMNALTLMDPKRPDFAELENIIISKYGIGEQALWNPSVRRAFPRPGAIEATSTSEFPGGTPYYDPVSVLTKNYTTALGQFLRARASASDVPREQWKPQGELQSFYTEISGIFSSASRGVEKLLQASFMAGSVGGRYNFSSGAGFNTVVTQTALMNNMLRGTANAAFLMGEEYRDFMSLAMEQVYQYERVPGLMTRYPILQKPGGVQPVWITTTQVMRKLGIRYPEASEISRGKIRPGSVFATGIAFSAGPLIAKMVGDWDLDQGQLTMLAKADPSMGLLMTMNEELHRQLSLPTRGQVAEMRENLALAMGTKGLVAGGEMNVMAEAFSDIITKGMRTPRADPFEPVLQRVSRADIWQAGISSIGATQGMGIEYNTRRLLEASASALGWSGESVALGHTASGLRYQEYLDKLRSTLRYTTTLLGTAIFETDQRTTGAARIIGKMGQEGPWPTLWEAGPQMRDHPLMGEMIDYLSLAVQKDVEQMRQSTTGDFAAFALAMREQDIPRLRGWIREKGVQGALFGEYIPFLEGLQEVYDPTRTPLGLALVGQTMMKAYGWGGRQIRQAYDPLMDKKRSTMDVPAIEGAAFQFMGTRMKVGDIARTPEMMALKAGYGFLTRKFPPTYEEVGNLYGMALDLENQGRSVPILWQQMLGRYDAAMEAQTVVESTMMGGTPRPSTFFEPDPYLAPPVEKRLRLTAPGLDIPGLTIKWKGRGWQGGRVGGDIQIPGEWGVVGEQGAELIVPAHMARIYSKQVTDALQMGMLGAAAVQDPDLLQQSLANALSEAVSGGVFKDEMAAMLKDVAIQQSSSYPSTMRQPALSKAVQAMTARRALIAEAPRFEGMMEEIYQLLPETDVGRGRFRGSTWGLRDPSEMLLDVISQNLPGLQRLYQAQPKMYQELSKQFIKASAFQQVRQHPEVLATLPEEELALQRAFLTQPTRPEEQAALYAAKAGAIIQSQVGAAIERPAGGRRGAFGRMMAELPVETMQKFAARVEQASESLKGFYETIEREGPETRAGKAALRGITQELGGIRRRALGLQLPVYAEAETAAWERYRAEPTAANLADAVQTTEAGMTALAQYRTAGAAERGGMRTGTQVSRFMRGLIGGWGLMYMGHLAQFPMMQAQFGFAEAEAFQMGMAGYAGGQLGPGVQPFPSIQMQMQRAQLAYGGQGFGAMQAAQAGMAPLTRDIAGLGLAGAAGGALALYFGQVATTALGAESALAGLFGAAVPWAAAAGVGAYGYMQYEAWKQQPQQTMAAALIGRYKGGGMPQPVSLQQMLMGQPMFGQRTPGQLLELGGAVMRELSMTNEQRQQTELIDLAIAGWREGRPGYTPSLIPAELQPVAAQFFATTMREGLDVELGGQAYLRLGTSGLTPQQIEDIVWAQQRGIDTPGLATQLMQAGRRRITQERGAALEAQIMEDIPDIYQAGELGLGAGVMAQTPISMLNRMYGRDFELQAAGLDLAPWARSDFSQLFIQEGALESAANTMGLARSPANLRLLQRIKEGKATRTEIRNLAISQARETRAQSVATQIGYYAPELAQGAYQASMLSREAEQAYTAAATAMPQGAALGISANQILRQFAGRGIQGTLLGQQALGMTQQYAMWGGQQTSQFFGWASGNLGNQIFAQRLMRQDPLAFAEAAMEGVPGMAQYATTVDIGLGGELTGLAWGTTSLARAGQIAGAGEAGRAISAVGVAQGIWGDAWRGTGWGEAAVRGITTPYGQRVAGMRGLQWYMRGLQWEQQQASMGIAAAQIALQEEYMPQFWAIQDQQRALAHEQRMYGFDMQQRQFRLQGAQFQEQMGLQRQGQLMQRGWAMQDWAWQDQMRTMQWGWRVEDFEENVRFMSGRQRKLAERQMERETIMYGMEGERIDEQRNRQKEMWALEDARFEMQKKHFQETRQLQEENMEKQKEFYLEGKKLQDEMIKLQREYQMKQLELQKAAVGVQAEYAEKSKEAQEAMLALSQEQEDNMGLWKVAQSRQVEMINTIVDGMNWIIKHAPDAFKAMLTGDGAIPPFTTDKGSGGGGKRRATGGPISSGQYAIVGEGGLEVIKSSVPQHVFPSNETFAAMLGGADNMLNDPWAQTVVNTVQGTNAGGKTPTTIVINIGDERLAEFVLDTMSDALEVR